MTTALVREPALSDDHSVLLWQTCAYADDLTNAARDGRQLIPAHDAMLEFLHYRLLPYLGEEERQLPPERLRDEHMRWLLIADHDRLRDDVDNIEASRSRQLLTLAAQALVHRLDRHVHREQVWVAEPDSDLSGAVAPDWALPLLLTDEVDVDALPREHRDRLVLQRLTWLRPGDVVDLDSAHDLDQLWRRQYARDPDRYVWVFEQIGPPRWRARVTRRPYDDDLTRDPPATER